MKDNNLFLASELPEPLTKEELYYYFKKYQNGDNDAKKIIIKHNIRLVINRVLYKFNNTAYDKKDLISIGIIGLIKGINTFNIDRNIQFTTYVIKCIDNEILMYIRKEKKHLTDISMDIEFDSLDNPDSLKLEDKIPDQKVNITSTVTNKELFIELHKLVNKLPKDQKEIISLYFGFFNNNKITQKEIANKLNMSQANVSKLINKIILKIGFQLQEEGFIEIPIHSNKVKVKKKLI